MKLLTSDCACDAGSPTAPAALVGDEVEALLAELRATSGPRARRVDALLEGRGRAKDEGCGCAKDGGCGCAKGDGGGSGLGAEPPEACAEVQEVERALWVRKRDFYGRLDRLVRQIERQARGPWDPPLPDAWEQGDAIPTGETGCEGWTFRGRMVPFLDPAPCAGAQEDLGWWLNAGVPVVTRLRDAANRGRWRMYFVNGSLENQDALIPGDQLWPLDDSAGNEKFLRDQTGRPIFGTESTLEYWRAYPTTRYNVSQLHFSPEFIGFLDSDNGTDFPMYAPTVTSTDPDPCEYTRPANPPITDFNPSDGRRAGWRSTAIPSTGRSVVFRSPSVVYISSLDLYLMFVVECDGRGRGSGGEDIIDGEDVTCSICIPCDTDGDDHADRWPTTKLVYFICASPAFQDEVMGPFNAMELTPDWQAQSPEWIGVPQAFLSPRGDLLLLYVPGSETQASAGMHARCMDEVEQVLQNNLASGLFWTGSRVRPLQTSSIIHSSADAPTGKSAPRPIFLPQHNLGIVQICGETPGLAGASYTDPNIEITLTDEAFIFCDGRLHLFFTNRDTSDYDGANPDVAHRPLRFISHAAAQEPLEIDTLCPQLAEGVVVLGGQFSGLGGKAGPTLGIPIAPTSPRPTPEQQLTQYNMGACNPINIHEWLEAEEVAELGTGNAVTVEVNDPALHFDENRDLVLVFTSAALGGIVYMTAPIDEACSFQECAEENV